MYQLLIIKTDKAKIIEIIKFVNDLTKTKKAGFFLKCQNFPNKIVNKTEAKVTTKAGKIALKRKRLTKKTKEEKIIIGYCLINLKVY